MRYSNKIFSILKKTTVGKALEVFQKWKSSVPERIPRGPANDFQHHLQHLHEKRLKSSLEALKADLFEGEAAKKRALNTLFLTTMSQHRRLFLKWKSTSRQISIIR